MLECGANYQIRYGGKKCKQCNNIDDEDHWLNYGTTFRSINFYDAIEKVDFQIIYAEKA